MGLDNIIYEKRGVKDKQLSEILAPLGSGIMVDGDNSFRGKMYDGFISDITGYSLYETDDWTHEDIEKVIVSLKDYKNNFDKIIDLETDLEHRYHMDVERFDAFVDLFVLCLEKGWRITAWY